MASYDGGDIFGYAVQMKTVDNPRDEQENGFPGLSGVEGLDQGKRGRFTIVTGRHVAVNGAALAAIQENFRSYDDGIYRVLVDTRGITWLVVRLLSFEPEGKIDRFANTGACHQRYTARFKHLV